ncbi:hypothetical protein H6F76_04915 [Leptolyngbya sp. FACHB-321]|uniref:hypothetical protein n=1 Tax=Leptolyngbya sp. FACHB-321 TaxID=2692807 RepID=UPI00168580E7|nr:hypothetical protein [Leptolyngbya sp. FACHB-321]MBD2034376.1 hypothetical protein [Leptolyngbya sp. FACHB-321]
MNRPLKKIFALSSVSLLLGSQAFLPTLPAHAQSAVGPNGCPAGTREGQLNLINNGTFTASPGVVGPLPPNNPAGFTSSTPYRGDGVYPSDNVGGLSIQNGPLTDPATPSGIVSGRGVTAAEASRAGLGNTPINTYLYSNPNANATTPGVPQSAFPNPVVWRQTLTTLRPNTTYNFKGLFFNLLVNVGPPGSNGVPPEIRLQVSSPVDPTGFIQPTTQLRVGDPAQAVPGFEELPNVRQSWIPTQFAFTTGATPNPTTFQILDEANDTFGDDFGFTALGVRECLPTLGVSKSVGTPVLNANGTYTIPYTVLVRNFAPVGQSSFDITNLQLTDNLAQTFANATLNGVTSIQSPTLTVNTAFNGSSNQNLLQGTDTLPSGTTATITFSVNVTPGTGANGLGPFPNTTTVAAISQGGSPLSDQSNDGANADPDGDGNPNNNNTPTVVSLSPTSGGGGSGAFRLVKRITNVTRNGTSLSGINFGTFIDAPGDVDNTPGFTQLQPGGAPIGQINLDPASIKLQSGDDVEYTVYYLSDGTAPAIGVSLCDPIPLSTTLIANTTQVQRNNGAIAAGGTVFAPLAPLPVGNSCTDASNQNGTVIFDLGDIPNTVGNNFGFVRFRVRVN